MLDQPDNRVTSERLLAVQRALDTRRIETEVDILLDSIVAALASEGPMPETVLVDRVCEMWPGAGLQAARVVRAAKAGLAGRLLAEQRTLDGEPGYALLASAEPHADLRRHVDSTLERTRAGVKSRFQIELGRELSDTEAVQLTTALVDVLAAGIRQAFDIFSGAVRELTPTALIPERWDREAITDELNLLGLEEPTRDVMSALVLSALDPSSQFGSDIVSQIATGYILHAFLARRDQEQDIQAAGVMAGTRILIDTPLLLTLTGRSANARSLTGLIVECKKAHLQVVIPEHCMQEMNQLLLALEQNGPVDTIRRALADGADPYILAQTVEHTALQAWLSHERDGRPVAWDQYRQRAANLGDHLVELGCNIMRLPDTDEAKRLHRRMCRSMEAVLRERPRAGQEGRANPDAVRADGATLALAHTPRHPESTRFWPQSWVLTPDRRMSDAYEREEPQDRFAVTIQPPQLAALLATFVTPAAAPQLAKGAATMLSHDTFLEIASRYPAAVAGKLAKALREEDGPSEVDVRLAQQTTLEELFEGDLPGPDELPDHVVAAVVDRRARRREMLASQEANQARQERDEAVRKRDQERMLREAAEESAAADAKREERRHSEREKRLRREVEVKEQEKRQLEGRAIAAARHARTNRIRGLVSSVSLLVLAAAGALSVFTDLLALAIGTALAAAVIFYQGWQGATEDRFPWGHFLAGFGFELIGIIDLLR